MAKKIFFILLIGLFSCSKNNIEHTYPKDPDNDRNKRAGKLFSHEIILYGKKTDDLDTKPSIKIGKEGKLFASAKKVASDIYNLNMVNIDLGLIASDWKIDLVNKTRTKINILIRGEEILAKNIDISVYQQYLDKNYRWRIKNPKNKEDLIKLLKDKIIKQAQ